MKNTQRGYSPLLVIIVVAALALAGYSLYTAKGKFISPQPLQADQNLPAIQNDSNLQTVESDLDKINTTELDTELNRLNSDTSVL